MPTTYFPSYFELPKYLLRMSVLWIKANALRESLLVPPEREKRDRLPIIRSQECRHTMPLSMYHYAQALPPSSSLFANSPLAADQPP